MLRPKKHSSFHSFNPLPIARFRALVSIAMALLMGAAQGQFINNNLAVLVATSNAANNTTVSVVEINKTTAGQSAIQTIAIPGIRVSGSATSTLYAANSADGRLLCFTGALTADVTSNVNTLNPRAVITVNNTGTVVNNATTYTGASGNQTRGATTLNGTTWYIGDQGGFYTNGSTSASPAGNIRSVKTFGGVVYGFTASASAAPVGVISAPSGGTFTGLPGLPNGATSRQDFHMVASGNNGCTFDVLYVLDATGATAGTIFKYSLVSGVWTANGTYSTGVGGFGLAAERSGSGASLYLSTGTGATAANSVRRLNDLAGYNATINIDVPNIITLYTTGAGTTIKGVAFAPQAAPTTQDSQISFSNVLTGSMDISWTNGNGAGRVVKMNSANTFTAPADGSEPTANNVYGGGEQVIYRGTGSTVSVTGLAAGTTYWVRVYGYNGACSTAIYNTATATNNPNSQSSAYTVPTITSIAPNSANAGGGGFTLTVNGTNFFPASVVNWNGSARTTTFGNSGQVTATINAADISAAGSFPVTVTNPAPGGGTSNSATFTVNPAASPVIQVTGTLNAFSSVAGTPSASQTYTVSGSNLTNDIQIAPPAEFEVSLDNTSWTVNPNSITLTQSGGTVASTTLYARMNPVSPGAKSGNIVHTSTGATTVNLAVSGTALALEPTANGSITATSIGVNSLTLNFSGGNGANRIVVAKAAGATSFTPADGATVSGVNSDFSLATNQGAGDRVVYEGNAATVNVTGLSSTTLYAFTVYEYNGAAASANYLTTGPASTTATTLASEPTANGAITFGAVTETTIAAAMTGGNGAGRIVVVRAGSPVSFTPTDAITYAGVSANFSTAADQGGGNKIVFDGSGTAVTVSGLSANSQYYFAVFNYNGTAATTNYTATGALNNTATPGPINYNGAVYTQDFNGLPTGAANTALSTTNFGNGPFYVSTAPFSASGANGWQYVKTSGSGTDVRAFIDNGTSTTGAAYSYGTANAVERAFGSLATGTVVPALGLVLVNNTGTAFTTATISYTGEQWRVGGSTPNALTFDFLLNGVNIASAGFTAVSQLDFNAPINSGANAALDGNLLANRVTVTQTFDLGGNWLPGQRLVLRFSDLNDPGNDHGLAIDDFSFTATPPVAPTVQDNSITFGNVLTTSMDVNWTNGDGARRIVVARAGSAVSFTPANFTAYTGVNADLGAAADQGSGNKIVYDGTGSTVNVTGLSPSTTYHFQVFAYNGNGVSATYNTATATGNPNSQITASPTPPTKLAITAIAPASPLQYAPPAFPNTFSVTVEAQDNTNAPQIVASNTLVTLTLANGNGSLSGTLTGTILAGTSSVTITGVRYDTPEPGVQLQAAGGALTPGTSAAFTVLGVATDLNVVTTPITGVVNAAVGNIVVHALRTDATLDVNYGGAVTLSVLTGPGNIGGTLTVNAIGGVATFANITFDTPGPYQLQASATQLFAGTSAIIYITQPATLTELVVPRFIGSKSASGTNATRTPFAVCVRFDNLVPNTSYDVRTNIGLTSDAATTYGAGNVWNGAAYSGGTITNAFSTDGTGSSGPYWIYYQPTGNATRFGAGQVHNLRLSMTINGQPMPANPLFVTGKTITALDIASTALTGTAADDGAYLRGSSQACVGGKFILVYDNVAGTGDPLYSYQAITTTATDNVSANYSGHPTNITNLYLQASPFGPGDFVAVVPIGANNPNGVRRVEARNADNTLFNAITDADGIWPGGANFTTITRRAQGVLTTADPNLQTAPAVTTGTYGPACANGAAITLGGSPTGGVWTGTGVSGSYDFTPSAGTQTLTYTFTDGNNCVSSGTTSITVNAAPVVTCGGPYGPACSNGTLIALTGSPAGGTWSGTGISGNNFDPAAAGPGSFTLTYTYTDGNGCSGSCTTSITVNPAPVVTCGGPYGPACSNGALIALTGSPAGGTWSGTGVSGNNFDPAAAGPGSFTLTYTYSDGNGCAGSCTTSITVNPAPVVTCGGPYGPVCINGGTVSLSGSPVGGTWSGTGVTGNSFDPATAGAGTWTLTYSYTDGNGCSNSCTTSITVNPLPVVTCPTNITGICSSDAAFALTGGSPAGGTYSGPGVSGGNFDPAVAGGGVHTITYSYTNGNSCSNTCQFTITVTTATTWYQDQDADGFGDPDNSTLACTQPVGYVANSTDDCPTTFGVVGSTCNDGNPFTTADVLQNDCSCAGTPVPCDNWTLSFTSDGAGSETTWQIVDATSPFILASGGGSYGNNTTVNETVCVPQGACFRLTVNDAGNNGITGGGWKLTDNFGRVIVDNTGNGGAFTSSCTTGEPWCNEPSSTQTLIASSCGRTNWLPNEVIIASANPAVSAQWGIGDQTDDGYQFWFENPVGGYTRRIFRNHATSGGNGPANALRATKLALGTIVSNPLPANTLLNVRVRSRVNGVNGNWGPVCLFKIDPTSCTLTKLNDDISSPNYSCGVTGKVVGASGQAGKLFAKVVYSGGSPATNYRFQFVNAGAGYTRVVTNTSAGLLLGNWNSNPLLCGTNVYDVRVAASFDGGTTFCPYGDVCTVEITNNNATPLCTPINISFGGGAGERVADVVAPAFTLYPNPNREGQLFVSLTDIAADVNVVTVDLFDLFGKRVLTATLPVQDGLLQNNRIELNSELAAGLYVVNVTAGDFTTTERLVIQR